MLGDPRLASLLNHPAIWRGSSAARTSAVSTGFSQLDAHLPGQGWPQVGLIEILVPRLAIGELYLVLPALASLSRQPQARWCAWITPPAGPFGEKGLRPFHPLGSLELFAPALAAHGVSLARVLAVRAEAPLWACEQALRSGACDVVLAWVRRVQARSVRRLQLATERGRTLGFLFRTLSAYTLREPSRAAVRIALQMTDEGVRLKLLKCRGGSRANVLISFWDSRVA